MMEQNFSAYSKYYDLLYRDKQYQQETDYVAALINKNAPTAKNILELGSGTGKHARMLGAKGFSVVGVERSAEMVRLAELESTENVSYQVSDITSFTVTEKFDVCLSLFHVISYLTENNDLIKCFKLVHAALNPGGLFVFDVWHSPAVYVQKPETRIRRISDDDILVTRLAESVPDNERNVVDVNYEVLVEELSTNKVTRIKETHPMRHFSKPEIDLLAAFTGFKVLKSEEFLTGNAAGNNTWGVCYILKKQ